MAVPHQNRQLIHISTVAVQVLETVAGIEVLPYGLGGAATY